MSVLSYKRFLKLAEGTHLILFNKLRFLILFWGSLATINFDSIVLILISALSIENNYFPLVSGRLKMPYLSL